MVLVGPALLIACATPQPPLAIPPVGDQVPTAEENAGPGDGRPSVEMIARTQRQLLASLAPISAFEPDASEADRASLADALSLLATDGPVAAAAAIEASREETVSPTLEFNLGTMRFQQGDLDAAAVAFERAIAEFPRFRRAWQNLGQVHYRAHRYAPAAHAFARVLELGGKDALTYGLLGACHSKRGHHVAAETAFRAAMMMQPAARDWKFGLAHSLVAQRRYAEAAALFGDMIVEQPDNADYWLAQGEAYAQLGQPMRAAANFEVVDRLGSATSDCLHNLGDIYANEQLYDLAVDAHTRGLERDSVGDVERALRAAVHLVSNDAVDESRRLVDAVEHRRGELWTEDERAEVLRVRARIAVAEGAAEEQVEILEEIVALDPLDGDALIMLGRHYGRNGDVERAVLTLERAAALADFEARAVLRHAQVLVEAQRYADALPLLRRAQNLDPREAIQRYLEQVERAAGSGRG